MAAPAILVEEVGIAAGRERVHTLVQVLGISGSLGRASANAAVLERIAGRAPATMRFRLEDFLSRLPHFRPDLEETPPSVDEWRAAIDAADVVLIASPEYGHSLPGVLKNGIDWVIGSGEFHRKPVAVTAAVPHVDRGRRGLVALCTTLTAVDASIIWSEPIVVADRVDDQIAHLIATLTETIDGRLSRSNQPR